MSEIQIRDFSSYTDLLPTQFSDSENLINLLSIYLDQVEELNLAQQSLGEVSTDLEAAFGYQLDLIGNLLGVSRLGMGDNDYRDAIRFGISINTGSGTPEDVIGFLQTITKATKIRYWEHYPACTVLETNGTNIPKAIPTTLDNVTPAGVKTGGVIIVEDNICFRPCRLSEAYSNRVFTGNSSEVYQMGDPENEMGLLDMEMLAVTPADSYFKKVAPDTTFGNSILPNLSETVKDNPQGTAGMGDPTFEMGNFEMEMKSLVVQSGIKKGRLANILTDKS